MALFLLIILLSLQTRTLTYLYAYIFIMNREVLIDVCVSPCPFWTFIFGLKGIDDFKRSKGVCMYMSDRDYM